MLINVIHATAQFAACAILATGLAGCIGGGGSTTGSGTPTVGIAGSGTSAPARNTPPTITGSPTTRVTVGSNYGFRPQARDADADRLTFSILNRPGWAQFNRTTGALTGTPQSGDAGVFRAIVISVSDGSSTRSLAPFTITVAALSASVPVNPSPTRPPVTGRVSHPGHYISLLQSDTQATMIESIKPGVTGFQKRYTWASLEPKPDNYDFSEIASDLKLLAGQGMRLVVFVEDKSFDRGIPTPAYLANYKVANSNGGYTAIRWSPTVVDRMKKLVRAMGARFNGNPALEGIAFQESAPSLNSKVLTANGYTPEKYRDAEIGILTTAAQSFPTAQIFWYMNFFPKKQNYIADIAKAVTPLGVAMGGPDILPDEPSLVQHTYPFYNQFRGKLTLFCSMQFDSYSHVHKNKSAPTKYWTMPEMFRFARDQLHVSYVFWNRMDWRLPKDSYNLSDALPVIAANPAFNQ